MRFLPAVGRNYINFVSNCILIDVICDLSFIEYLIFFIIFK